MAKQHVEGFHGSGSKYGSVYVKSTPEIYDQWAFDGYDETVHGTISPSVRSVSSVFASMLDGKESVTVLDAGCGTGVLAVAAREAVSEKISLIFDGVDYSAGMLKVAASKDNYRQLEQADLKLPLELEDESYTGVISSGTFLQGHVGPEAIPELCRVLAPDGVMVFSVRPNYFEETRDEWLCALKNHGMVDIKVSMLPYKAGDNGAEPMLGAFVSSRKRNPMHNKVINFAEKLSSFSEHWEPRVISQMNDYELKLVKVLGEFTWHKHDDTDEVFIVLKGQLHIDFRDKRVTIKMGEMCTVKRGDEHKPYAEVEAHILLIEPKGVVNTGDSADDILTAANDVWI